VKKLTRVFIFSSLVMTMFCAGGCATREAVPNEPVQDYLEFLQTHPGANLQGAREEAAIRAFQAFLSDFTKENVTANARKVYARDAWLNDTLKTVQGSAEIEEYFLGSVENTDEIRVEFTDVARSGNDYYFRWIMDVKFKKFHRGKVVRTIGMTHVRFNADGQAILHQDYWDSAQGLFEYVPVIGGGIRFIKSRL